jgi:peroxiredoxin
MNNNFLGKKKKRGKALVHQKYIGDQVSFVEVEVSIFNCTQLPGKQQVMSTCPHLKGSLCSDASHF